jgi:uncharacterized protein (TIGR03435 family)
MSFPPGRIEVANTTLTEMVNALNGYNGRVEGGPKRAQTDRYDIVAKTSALAPPAQLGKVLLSLLEDRFKLTLHQDPRESSGLALTVGKKSPNLPAAKEGEETKTLTRPAINFQASRTACNVLSNSSASVWSLPRFRYQ